MSKSQYIHKMFEDLSGVYDFMNNIVSLGMHKSIKKKTVKNFSEIIDIISKEKTHCKILDLCCGTGDVSIEISRHFGSSVSVIGADFSEKMLKLALKKTSKYENIEFVQADALNLPFEEESFDAVFISFGLRNLENLDEGLKEIKRVLKTCGWLVNLDTGKPSGIFGVGVNFFLFAITPILAKLFIGKPEPYRYLFSSMREFLSKEELSARLLEHGFSYVKAREYLFGGIASQFAKK